MQTVSISLQMKTDLLSQLNLAVLEARAQLPSAVTGSD